MEPPLRLGVLNAISPAEEGDLDVRMVDLFQALLHPAGEHLELVEYSLTAGAMPSRVDACDAYLLSGSHRGVYDADPWIPRLGDFLRQAYAAERPLVGICFGHQMLAHALDGRAEKWPGGWGLGRRPLTLRATPSWMTPLPPAPALYYAHQDQVTRLPPGAQLLAVDPFCPYALFAIDRRVLAIQGHPEFGPALMRRLVTRMADQVGPAVARQAADSLDAGATAGAVVGQWIVNFLGVGDAGDGPGDLRQR